jgi:hypothetical protein
MNDSDKRNYFKTYLPYHQLTNMKKNQTLANDAKGRSILQNAIQSTENEQMDLYKAIFGGIGSECPVVAVTGSEDRASAYDKTDAWLRSEG